MYSQRPIDWRTPNAPCWKTVRQSAPILLAFTLIAISGCGGGSSSNQGPVTYAVLSSTDSVQFQEVSSFTETDSNGTVTTNGPETDYISGLDMPLGSFIESDSPVVFVSSSTLGTAAQQATQKTESGYTYTYFKNDSTGLYLYGQDQADTTGKVTGTLRYNPYLYLPSTSEIPAGKTISEHFTLVASVTDGTSSPVVSTYTATITGAGMEAVTVPAGTFANATKVNVSMAYSLGSGSTSEATQGTTASTIWLYQGIGEVKEIDSDQSRTSNPSNNNQILYSDSSSYDYELAYSSIAGTKYGTPVETESRAAKPSPALAQLHRLFALMPLAASKGK